MQPWEKAVVALVALACYETIRWAARFDRTLIQVNWLRGLDFYSLLGYWAFDEYKGIVLTQDAELYRVELLCRLASDLEECWQAHQQYCNMRYHCEEEFRKILYPKWDRLMYDFLETNPSSRKLLRTLDHYRSGSRPKHMALRLIEERRVALSTGG